LEVILVNVAGAAAAAGLGQAGEGVLLVSADPHWNLSRQRDAGLQVASGEVVAVLNERYQVSPHWVEAVLQAHAQDYDVVAGAVGPAEYFGMAAWAMFFSEYSHACALVSGGVLRAADACLLPTGNSSYKRRAFALAEFGAAVNDSDFHSALWRAGARFFREARMQATFATPHGIREYMAERFAVSRNYAAHRAVFMSSGKRCVAAVLRLALPGLVVTRAATHILAAGRFRARFVAALPWMIVFGTVQMIGEICGYLKLSKPDSAGAQQS
jgi:hypothetical protein